MEVLVKEKDKKYKFREGYQIFRRTKKGKFKSMASQIFLTKEELFKYISERPLEFRPRYFYIITETLDFSVNFI